MPSTNYRQARLMAAVAHGWHPTRFKGPSRRVAREFNRADQKSGLLKRAARARRGR